MNCVTEEVCAGLFGIKSLTSGEIIDMNIIYSVGGHLYITALFFSANSLFYNQAKDGHKFKSDSFLEVLQRPVIVDDKQDEVDRKQRRKLARRYSL